VLAVKFFSFTLTVRAIRAALCRAFIWFQPAPREAVYDILLSARHKPALISIFNAENKVAVVLVGKQVVV
ncbi:MAG TPA: hypothetical protein VK628_00880, partial [Flavitalea sp.]|nr:hypothetical protein [Flavitalea sp.]